jgi:HK97 family phage portal protein
MRNEKVSGFGSRLKGAAEALFRGTFVMPVGDYKAEHSVMAAAVAGVTVNATSAQKFSAVFACIRTYEQIMGSLPIRVTGIKNGALTDLTDGNTYNLLHTPNKYMNRYSFMALMNAGVQIHGNAVAVIFHNSAGNPVELVPVEWSSVKVVLVDRQPIYIIDDRNTGIKDTFMHWQVIHFRINSRNGHSGISPISFARQSIGLGMAAEKYGAQFFEKGGNLKGVLETDSHMSDPEYVSFKQRWNEVYTGPDSNHDTPVLEYGLKYKPLGFSPHDSQFIETRINQVQDVARCFGLPPSVIGENSRNTFTNGEQQDIQFVKYSLSPLCKSEELELEFKLMPRNSKVQENIKFNLDWLLRGDMNARSRYEQTLVQAGILTRNEAREIENRGPLPGLDEPLDPAFLTGKKNNQTQNN